MSRQDGAATPAAVRAAATSEDRAGDVRAGEELDVAAVDRWIKGAAAGAARRAGGAQFSGGASNWTYRLRYDGADLVLRRPPAGTKAKSAHDMGREYRIQAALAPVYPYVPEMVGALRGRVGHRRAVLRHGPHRGRDPAPQLPARLDWTPARTRAAVRERRRPLVELHRVDVDRGRPRRARQGPGLPAPPDRRLVASATKRRAPGTCRASTACAAGSPSARPTTPATASSTTTTASTTSCSTRTTRRASSACSTGRWRPSATR